MSFEINPPAGVIRSGTKHIVGRRWFDSDKIRFINGKAAKIGGWQKFNASQTQGVVRGLMGWSTLAGLNALAAGTYIKAYSVTDEMADITPIEDDGTLATDPFAVTDTETEVVVTHVNHGRDVGATVHFDGASAGGGITIDGAYLVTSVVDADTYTIEHSSPATSTDATTGGASVAYEYEVNPGQEDTAYGLGYGAGPYGGGFYGTPRAFTDAVTLQMRRWWFARYGNMLMMAPSGGRIYLWDEPGGDDRGELLANSPDGILAMFVTPERFVFALGYEGNPMGVKWPHQTLPTNWTAGPTSTANTRTLQEGNRLVGGCALSSVSLVWSDTAAFEFQYNGQPGSIYYSRPIGTKGAGLIAGGAFAVTGKPARAFWMSKNDFLLYDGGVSPVPNQDHVREMVFRGYPDEGISGLNTAYTHKIWCGFNPQFNEIWWGYPSGSASECDRYVKVNIDTWAWDFGTITRSGMADLPSPARSSVLMTGNDQYIYEHEVGKNADGAAMQAFISTGTMMIADGDADIEIERYIHDIRRQEGDLLVRFKFKERPNSQDYTEEVTLTIEPTDTEGDRMMAGRHLEVTFESNEIDGDFELGTPLLTIKGGGRR